MALPIYETFALNFDESTADELVFDYTREHCNMQATGAKIKICTRLLSITPPGEMKAFFEFEIAAFREGLEQFEKDNRVG